MKIVLKAVYGTKANHYEAGKRRRIHSTRIQHNQYNNLGCPEIKNETTGILKTRYRAGLPRKTTAIDDKKHYKNWEERPDTNSQ